MLTINDLSRNEEISNMGKVAGGMDCDKANDLDKLCCAGAAVLGVIGQYDTGIYLVGLGSGLSQGACSK